VVGIYQTCVFVHAQAGTLSSALKFASVGVCVGVGRGVFLFSFPCLRKFILAFLGGGSVHVHAAQAVESFMHIRSACHACERVMSHVQAAHVFSVARKPAAEGLSSPCSSSGFLFCRFYVCILSCFFAKVAETVSWCITHVPVCIMFGLIHIGHDSFYCVS